MNIPGRVLQTRRLLLRDFCTDDNEWLGACFSEPESRQSILRIQRRPGYGSDFAKLSARYASLVPFDARAQLGFVVVLRDTLEPMGFCGLHSVARGSKGTLLGWHFSSQFRGLGYATEASRELIRLAFEERGVARVIADCYESNTASIRIFQKLGMSPVPGFSLHRWLLALKYLESRPIVRYAISSESWNAQLLAA